jgi:uncharacterized RDD family membrane protein YckC
MVVGFWRRVGADLLDILVLGAVGWAIAYPVRHRLSELGPRGVWGGLVINLLYAGVLQTRFGSGQTIGKRALGIQVLRLDGSFLGVGQSFARYLIVSFVAYGGMYASIANLLVPRDAEAVDAVFSLGEVLAFFACFLMIPLHPLRRGLRDLVSGSIVVYKDRYEAAALHTLEDPPRERRVLGLLGALGVLGFCVFLWGAAAASKQPDLTAGWRVERERVRADVLARTRANVPGIEDFERVAVRIESGFKMGIANWRTSR